MSTSPHAAHDDACCDSCGVPPQRSLSSQVAWLQYITIAWMLVECTLSLTAAAQPHSVALLAFGSDSLIELLSASVVLLQFLPRMPLKKSQAERIAAAVQDGLVPADDAAALMAAWHLASRIRNAIVLVRGRPGDTLPTRHGELTAVARLLGYPPGDAAQALEQDYRRAARRARTVMEARFYG